MDERSQNVTALEETTHQLHHAKIANDITRPIIFLLFAGQIAIGQLLPLLFVRKSLLLPALIENLGGRSILLVGSIALVSVLALAAFTRPLQAIAALGYSVAKFAIVYSLWNVDRWAAYYFGMHVIAGIIIAATTYRKRRNGHTSALPVEPC